MSPDITPAEVARWAAARLPGIRFGAADEARGPCPVHRGHDSNFALNRLTGFANCFSRCGRGWDIAQLEQELNGGTIADALRRVEEIIGRQPLAARNGHRASPPAPAPRPAGGGEAWRQVATFDYIDERGVVLYQVMREERVAGTAREKRFRQRRPDGAGGWVYSLGGVRRVPYRLRELLAADPGEPVLIAEGEKCVGALVAAGFVSTTNAGGSGSTKQFEEWRGTFAGRDIVILPDNDEPGRKHAARVAAILAPVVASVRVVELPGLDALGERADVVDWLAAGNTADELRAAIAAAPALDSAAVADLVARWGGNTKKTVPPNPRRTVGLDVTSARDADESLVLLNALPVWPTGFRWNSFRRIGRTIVGEIEGGASVRFETPTILTFARAQAAIFDACGTVVPTPRRSEIRNLWEQAAALIGRIAMEDRIERGGPEDDVRADVVRTFEAAGGTRPANRDEVAALLGGLKSWRRAGGEVPACVFVWDASAWIHVSTLRVWMGTVPGGNLRVSIGDLREGLGLLGFHPATLEVTHDGERIQMRMWRGPLEVLEEV